MLFTRYQGAVQEVLSLEFEEFIEQLNYVFDCKSDEEVKIRWINGYQTMSLDEFKQAINYRKPSECMIEQKPIENVLEDLLINFG